MKIQFYSRNAGSQESGAFHIPFSSCSLQTLKKRFGRQDRTYDRQDLWRGWDEVVVDVVAVVAFVVVVVKNDFD